MQTQSGGSVQAEGPMTRQPLRCDYALDIGQAAKISSWQKTARMWGRKPLDG
jgi:hypothetical protein